MKANGIQLFEVGETVTHRATGEQRFLYGVNRVNGTLCLVDPRDRPHDEADWVPHGPWRSPRERGNLAAVEEP